MGHGNLLAGASGYSFKEWKGAFYPADLKAGDMLPWYAERLPTVEINNTFYRLPRAMVLAEWAARTPGHFSFSIKASRRITHFARLSEAAAEPLEILYRNLDSLGRKRGPVLFQLPPGMGKDVPRLRDFLSRLPPGHQAAFEFRDSSWLCDEVYSALAGVEAALCVSERGGGAPVPPLVETAPWGYVRLRLESYDDEALRRWATALRETRWRKVHAYFMHEPTAPEYARRLMALWD